MAVSCEAHTKLHQLQARIVQLHGQCVLHMHWSLLNYGAIAKVGTDGGDGGLGPGMCDAEHLEHVEILIRNLSQDITLCLDPQTNQHAAALQPFSICLQRLAAH